MSKYNALWEYAGQQTTPEFKLTFGEVAKIAGVKIDHSFLNYKEELKEYGYEVGKISLKEKTVEFRKVEDGELKHE